MSVGSDIYSVLFCISSLLGLIYLFNNYLLNDSFVSGAKLVSRDKQYLSHQMYSVFIICTLSHNYTHFTSFLLDECDGGHSVVFLPHSLLVTSSV